MKQHTRYSLLFNKLWELKLDAIDKIKINPDIKIGIDWNQKGEIINKEHIGENMRDGIAILLSKENSLQKKLTDEEDTNEVQKSGPALFKPVIKQHAQNENGSQIIGRSEPINNVVPSSRKNDPGIEKQATDHGIHKNPITYDNWDELIQNIKNCKECSLSQGRNYVVIERGNRNAPWMFIGEDTSLEDDMNGEPFSGDQGELLNKMIAAMKLNIDQDVYICNAVKCKSLHSRHPGDHELDVCKQHLLNQINLVKPKIIIALGRFASQALLGTNLAVAKLRGTKQNYNNIPVIVTYTPGYLLRNVEAKKDAWADLQLALQVFKNLG